MNMNINIPNRFYTSLYKKHINVNKKRVSKFYLLLSMRNDVY